MKWLHAIIALLSLGVLCGCALITTPVKVVGTAATTAIKTTGAVISAPFKMADDGED